MQCCVPPPCAHMALQATRKKNPAVEQILRGMRSLVAEWSSTVAEEEVRAVAAVLALSAAPLRDHYALPYVRPLYACVLAPVVVVVACAARPRGPVFWMIFDVESCVCLVRAVQGEGQEVQGERGAVLGRYNRAARGSLHAAACSTALGCKGARPV
jgi:hypothetical protein